MINASNAFKKLLYEGKRDYLEYVDITLANGSVLNLTNKDLWGGGLTIEDAVSSEGTFDIGAAIINKCTVVINNINEDFSEYDFTSASVIAYVGLELPDGTIERKRKGIYAVDEAKYNGSIITLSCLDNMRKFDKAYTNSTLIYPASLASIIRDACSKCDMTLRTETFPHNDFVVNERPGNETTTFREVISWAAQIAGCFCRCDTYGRLEIKWYDQEALEIPVIDGGTFQPWTKGDTVSGGTFSPWTGGDILDGGSFGDRDGIHHIYARYSMDISVDDVVITGVRVQEKTEQDEQEAIVTYQSGEDGYVVSIENNDMVQGGAGEQIAEWLGDQLIGFRFRKASVSHPSDPTIEAGDVGFLSDRKGNTYRIVISSSIFSTGGSQTTNSSAQNPARNSADRLSAETKNYVDNRKIVEKERTDRERAIEQLSDKLANSPGLYRTEDPPGSPNAIQYLHDMPTIAESKTVIKITSEAIGISNDGGETYPYGLTLDDGTAILNKIYAIGIDADYITTGAFEIKKDGKTLVLMDKDTGQVILRPDVFELSSGKTVEEVAKDEADKKNKTFTSTPAPPYNVGDIWMNSSSSDIMTCINARSSGSYVSTDWQKRNKYIDQDVANTAASNAVNGQTQTDILNKLTNNGVDKGIYLQGGKLYISFNAARGGELTLGGASNSSGTLKVLNASSETIATIQNSGVNISKGYLRVNASSGSFEGVVISYNSGSQISKNIITPSGIKSGTYSSSGTLVRSMDLYPTGVFLTDASTGTQKNAWFQQSGINVSDLCSITSTETYFASSGFRTSGSGTFKVHQSNILFDNMPETLSSTEEANLHIGSSGQVRKVKTASSARYKDVLRKIDSDDIKGIYNITPVWAKYKDGLLSDDDELDGIYHPMLIAENVGEYVPYAVLHNEDGLIEDWNHRVLIPCIIQALKEQKKEIDELRSTISDQ